MPSDTTDLADLKLQPIRYWLGWLSRGFATGRWDSHFLGRGFNFQGIAPFRDDPDLIRINWQATLTSGELQVSQFSEERNVRMHLLANVGPSMAFGSQQTKLERLAIIAAILSFSAYRTKDYFRFVGYTDEVELGFPEPRDRTYPKLLAQAILEFDWRGKKRGGLVRAAMSIPSQRSLVVIVSDHLGGLSGTERALRIITPRHEVVPIILWDERETTLPEKGFGLYPLQDLESGEIRYVFLTRKNRERFRENSLRKRAAIIESFRRFGTEPHFLTGSSEEDLDSLVRIFLTHRLEV